MNYLYPDNITIPFNQYEKDVIRKLRNEAKKNKKNLMIQEFLIELFHKSFEDKMNGYDL